MHMIVKRFPRMDFEKFAKEHGLVLEATERGPDWPNENSRWYVRFSNVEIMDRGMLSGSYGNGSNIEEAVRDYAQELSGKQIAIDAMSPKRRNVDVPILTVKPM